MFKIIDKVGNEIITTETKYEAESIAAHRVNGYNLHNIPATYIINRKIIHIQVEVNK